MLEVECLGVRAEREHMSPNADGGVLRDLERVLREQAGAGLVRAGQQQTPIGRYLNQRIGHAGSALVA